MEKWMKYFFVDYRNAVVHCDRCYATVTHLTNGTSLADLVLAAGGHVCKQNPVEGEN
jgi:hypothetical protein